eukprot:jgi/Galph1/717/GphlegSOOS_G5586.1
MFSITAKKALEHRVFHGLKRYLTEQRATESLSNFTDLFFNHTLFDTEKLIEKLKKGGFTTSQSEVICDTLLQLCKKNIAERERIAAQKAALATLRSELQILEKTDIYILKSDVQVLEKKMEMQWAEIATSIEHIENRVRIDMFLVTFVNLQKVIKMVIGSAGTAAAIILLDLNRERKKRLAVSETKSSTE